MQGSSKREDDDDGLPDLVVMAQIDPPAATLQPKPKPTPKPKPMGTEKQVEPGRGKPRSKADRLWEEHVRKEKEHIEAMRKAYKASNRAACMGS